MATNKTNLFDKTLNGSFWNAGVTFERTNPTPLEKYSVFKTLDDAKTYASTNPVAYPGQIITVIAGEQEYSDWSFGELTSYTVTESDGKLYINDVEAKLSDNQLSLSAKVDNVDVIATRTVTKPFDVKPYQIIDSAGTLKPVSDTVSLTEALSINISESAGTTDGILKTYTFSQGGKDLDVKINIPKDFLVKSASLETVVEADIAEGGKLFGQAGFEVGDKYIDFVVNAKADASEESHVYLNVKDLVDVYTGSEGDIVDIAVDGTTVKATVKANSIGFSQLCAEVKEYVDTQDAATYLSAKNYTDAVSAETLISAKAYTDEKVGAEAAARTEAIQALSDALSGDVKTLADDYKTVKAEYAVVSADYKTVSADHENRIQTLETGTTALSGRMDTAEGNITSLQNIVNSTDLTALAAATGDAQKVASKKYVDDTVASIGDVLHFIGVVAVPEGMDLTASEGYQALYPDGTTPTKGDVVLDSVSGNEYVYADNYNGSAQWVVIGDENNHATKADLKAEEDARKTADTYLSGAIDNKIYYGDYGSVVSADSLSVVKISQDKYHSLVANDQVDDKAVYIVNNEGAYNMYDERIINVGAPVSANDAATKEYVDAAKEAVIAAIPLSVSQLIWDIEEINCGNAES